ncbi:MAG: tRNA lysidine(34) synthetase TilS, partial [Pseudomonadota bacterium]
MSPIDTEQQVLAAVTELLTRLGPHRRLLIAYSGGLDSHVLLRACVEMSHNKGLTESPVAVHINHQLQPQSTSWEEHCAMQAGALQAPFQSFRVDVNSRDASPEEAARQARYTQFRALLKEGDVVLTAHHADDQVETLLLQTLRGAGVNGLAAMPEISELGLGRLARPFLNLSQACLHSCAEHWALQWIEDPSNKNPQVPRSFLRQQVLPLIGQQWPLFRSTINRTASHCGEAALLCGELASLDAESCVDDNNRVFLDSLHALSRVRQKNVLRHWIKGRLSRFPQTRHIDALLD